ncbi:MAG: NAD(P)H-hydrate dehydratase [Paludibacteraceae bacterium]|nr:NAD(P)H-hydrate dehydratase [Paludibacteraceae bacterium]
MTKAIDISMIRGMRKTRRPDAHKGDFGYALLSAGSQGMMGAAVLASRACLRSGVGLLSVLTDLEERHILQTAVPEAMCVFALPDLSRVTAVGMGPGWGRSPVRLHWLQQLLFCNKPLVIDADAINLIAEYQLIQNLPAGSVLTPHEGEFDRLCGQSSSRSERIVKATAFAKTYQCVMVLKGHKTAVCTPDGEIFTNTTGNPGMATAGSGDVLTGLITGLLAQGYNASEAARMGVWLHGKAGDLAIADTFTAETLLSGDLTRYLSMAFKAL